MLKKGHLIQSTKNFWCSLRIHYAKKFRYFKSNPKFPIIIPKIGANIKSEIMIERVKTDLSAKLKILNLLMNKVNSTQRVS